MSFPVPPITESDESANQHLIRAAKQYLAARLSQPPQVDELAQALGVSKRRVCEAFRNSLGLTITQFCREERMSKEQRLLVQTSLDIQTIDLDRGISSLAKFSKRTEDSSVGTECVRRSRSWWWPSH